MAPSIGRVSLQNSTRHYSISTQGSSFLLYDETGGGTRFRLDSDGSLQAPEYGSGTFTGTLAYKLGVDSSGNIIETAVGAGAVDGSGTSNYITKWTDADTIEIV